MLNTTVHRKYMFEILVNLFQTKFAKNLAFKWWTACYFLHSLDRFSTDLDFNIIWKVDEENIFSEIKKLLTKYGTIKESYNKRFTIFFLFSYWETEMNIKIELNKRNRENNTYETINFFWNDIIVMDKASIFANKLVALTDRKIMVNRDLYDICFFYKNNFPINEKIITERTWKTYKEYLEFLIVFLSKVNKKTLLNWLWEVLNPKQKAFVKDKLLSELIWKIEFELKFS